MTECIEQAYPYRAQIRVRTAVSRTEVVRHEWGVLNTASAAFSHREGSMVTWIIARVGYNNRCRLCVRRGVRLEGRSKTEGAVKISVWMA